MQSPPNQTPAFPMSDNRVSISDNRLSTNHHGKPAGVITHLNYPGPSGLNTPVLQNSRPARKLDTTQASLGLSRPTLPAQPGPPHTAPHTGIIG